MLKYSSESSLKECELRKHALRIVQFSAGLALGDVNKAHPRGHPKHDALVDAMKTYEKKFADDIVRDAFSPYCNEPNPTKFTTERWLSAAKSSNTVRCLLSPTLSTNVWRVAFGDEGVQRCELTRISDVLVHPKGFAHLFDIEVKEIDKWGPPQKVQSLALSSSSGAAAVASSPAPSVAPPPAAEANDFFEVVALPVRRITVMLTTLSGRQIPVECSTTTTVWELKELVQAREGIPQEHQKLLWPQAHELVNTRTLSDYAVQDGQTLTLVVSVRKHTNL